MLRSPEVSLLQLLLCAAVVGWSGVTGQTELSCTVMIWGNQDFEWTSKTVSGKVVYSSRCITGVQRARSRCGGKKINFVPTHFWKGADYKAEPQGYCYKTNKGNDQVGVACTDLTNTNAAATNRLINRYYQGFKYCLKEAVSRGFTELKITPHLDDGAGQGGWRNTLAIDPWKKLSGYSYWDIMLRPSTLAVRDALRETKATTKVKVLMTLQGEMNYCLVAFPKSWSGIAIETKKLLALPAGRAKVGVSLNFNKLCGGYCAKPPKKTGTNEAVDTRAYRDLLYQMDYLGISHYPAMYETSQSGRWDFTGPIQTLMQELREVFGISLADLVRGKEFHLSEFGIGGGQSGNGREAAKSLRALADLTYHGMFGTYGQYEDPWKQKWASDFRWQFYVRTIRWLSNRSNHGSIKIDGAFVWCMSSWDFPGLYWTSYGPNGGTWYAAGLTKMVRDYNNKRTIP